MNWQDINEEQKKVAGFNFDYGPLLEELLTKVSAEPLVVELGTYLGCSAVFLAEKMKGKGRLYSVDTFDKYARTENFFPKAMSNIKVSGYRDFVHLLACRSWESASFFEDKEVDLVWVDVGHDYNSVRADLDAWHSKVKPGGILGGHDFSEAGVKLAVERFCFSAKKEFHPWNEGGWMSWWIQM